MRICSECEERKLDVSSEEINTYECWNCSSIWKRIKPTNDGDGNMKNIPAKLKQLIKKGKI